MKQVVILAVLFAGILWIPEYGHSKEKDESPLWPLMFHGSLDSRMYSEQSEGGSNLNQQYIMSGGATLKPIPFAWFHLGAASRYTQASGMENLYAEPATAKFLSGLTVLRNLFYVSAGLRLPLAALPEETDDLTAFSSTLNSFSILAQPNIIPLNSAHLGGYLTRTYGPVRVKFGLTYIRANFHTVNEEKAAFPPPIMNYRLETDWRSGGKYHRVEAKLSNFSEEKTRLGATSLHKEGRLYQARYGMRLHLGPSGLETAAGLAIKGKDEGGPLAGSYWKNLQRGYVEFNWMQPHINNSLIHGRLTPQILYRNIFDPASGRKDGSEWGTQNELYVSYKFKTRANRFLKVSVSTFYGFIGEETIIGGSLKMSYTIHRVRQSLPGIFPGR